MTRYKINSKQYSIHVGYDQPLRTFFATVEDLNLPNDEDDNYLLLWIGRNYDEIRTCAELAQQIAQYCSIPYKIITKLENDSREPFEPSYTQSLAEDFFGKAIAKLEADLQAESDF